jgi:hypothetical protein
MDGFSYVLPYEMSVFLRDESVDTLTLLHTYCRINHKHFLLVQFIVFAGKALRWALAITPL